jgi:hypothetical protein
MGAGHCLGPEGNGVSLGKGGEGGRGPPRSKEDKRKGWRQHGQGQRGMAKSGVMKKGQRTQWAIFPQDGDYVIDINYVYHRAELM